jgi:hypothetical protein
MLERVATPAVLAMVAIFGQSCGRDGGTTGTERLPTMRGKFVFEDDARTQPLSGTYHSIFYVDGEDRTLIFKGYYASKPIISLLNPEAILVSYCGGSIIEVSPFREGGERKDGSVRLINVQPVVSSGINANGREVCPSSPRQ